MAIGMEVRGKRSTGGRHRRKLCCGDYNPAHVESGRLQSFPVQGAFASAGTATRYSEL
jgi:hypothetical protein